MFRQRGIPNAPDAQQAAHEHNAARARKLIAQGEPAANPRERREIDLLKANALATLAVYELLLDLGYEQTGP